MELKVVPERDIIWLAGIVDGEGSIYVRKQKGKFDIHSLDIEISMTDKPTIERIFNTLGFGNFRAAKRKKKQPHHRQAWKVVWSSKDAVKLLHLIIPYLVTKKDEAFLALEFMEHKKAFPGRLNEEIVEVREDFYIQMKELKKIEYPMEVAE